MSVSNQRDLADRVRAVWERERRLGAISSFICPATNALRCTTSRSCERSAQSLSFTMSDRTRRERCEEAESYSRSAAFRDPAEHRGIWRERVDGIEVHWIPVRYSDHVGFWPRIRAFIEFAVKSARIAAAIPTDRVFATSTPLTIVLPGVYAAWRQRKPMVFEVRDLWPELSIALGSLRDPVLIRLARWLERLAYRRAARVIALSPIAWGLALGGDRFAAPDL